MGTTQSLVAVMAIFGVNLTGLREMARWLVNNILGCVCEGVSRRGEHLSQETAQRRWASLQSEWASPSLRGITQFLRARVEHNSGEREDFLA